MKKSLKKQAVFPVLMLLVVTALALVGSSFAWFSVANKASVATITGQAEDGGVGLMISDKWNGTFSGSVTMSTAADYFVLPKYLKQLSSADATNFFAAEIKSKDAQNKVATIQSSTFTNYAKDGVAGQTGNLDASDTSAEGVAAANGTAGYIDFTVYLQVEQEAYLFLQAGTSLDIADTGTGTAQTGAYRIAVGTPVAVTGNAKTQSTSFTIYGDTAESADTWYPIKAASETPFAAYDEVPTYSPAGQEAKAFSTIINGEMNDTQMNATDAGNAHTLGTLAVGVNAITFRIWLEGNDPDCTVEVALDTIALTLQFFACKKVA